MHHYTNTCPLPKYSILSIYRAGRTLLLQSQRADEATVRSLSERSPFDNMYLNEINTKSILDTGAEVPCMHQPRISTEIYV